MSDFDSPYEKIANSNRFQPKEVGLTHPEVPGFVRIKDNGNIEIVASEGLSIIMDVRTNSITFVADTVRFMTKDEGFRWNKLLLNSRARKFNEPTFLDAEDLDSTSSIFHGVNYYAEIDKTTEVNALEDLGRRLDEFKL